MAGNSGEFVSVVDRKAKSDVDDLIKKVIELREAVNKSGNAFKGIKVPTDAKKFINELNSVLRQNNILLEQQLGLNERLVQSTTRVNNARATSYQRTQEEITNSRLLVANASRAAQANSTFANSYERLSAQQNIAARAVQNLIARGRQAGQSQRDYNRELRTAQTQFDQLNTRVVAADRAVGRFNRNVGNYPMQAARGLKDLLMAFGVVGGVQAFAAIAKDIFQTTKELQSLDFALKQVSGSNEAFGESQAFLQRISEAYGIEIMGLTRSYTGFLAASKNAIDAGQITAEQINQIFESVSKASGAMGLSVEQQQGAFLALQQMISKGNVQAEEIRGQLAERLPGAFGILAKSMGVTEVELNKLLKDGKVLAAEVLPAFARELEKAYGVENLKRVENLAAATTRLGNSWTEFIRDLNDGGGSVSRFFKWFVEGAADSLKALSDLVQSKDSLLKDLGNDAFSRGSAAAFEQITESAKNGSGSLEDWAKAVENKVIPQLKDLNNDLETAKNAFKLGEDAGWLRRNFDPVTFKNWKQAEQDIKTITESIGYANGELAAAKKILNKDEKKFKIEDKGGKTKRQKADIDYLREIYELRKTYTENEIEDNDRIMNNEEVNYDKRLSAANNYYHLKDVFLKDELEENIRLNNLEAKNQTEQYKLAIAEGKASSENLTEIEYKRFQKEERLNAEFQGKKNALTIESAKKLQGVLDNIQDQAANNRLSQQGLDDLRQAGLLLNGVSGSTTVKQFAELENKMRSLNDAEQDTQTESLRIELRRVQAEKDRVTAQEGSISNNAKIGALTAKELDLEKQILTIENERKKAVADLYKEMKQATTDYLSSFSNGFLSDLGFSSLSSMFDQVTYDVVNSLGEIETKTGSTFQKLYDQAGTTRQKLAVVFNAMAEVAQEAFAFVRQNQQAAFDAELAGLEQEYSIRQKFANGNADAEEELERQLAEKKRDIRIREAKAAKEAALFNAIINTSQAVVSALASGPQGIALALIVGALGAAQIALIASQEVPAYAEGTDNHIGGKAWVGDGGRHEVIKTPDGKLSITPNKATLVDLPKGSKVYPDIASSGILSNGLPAQVVNNIEGLTRSDMERVMSNTLAKMPVNNITLNKRGIGIYAAGAGAKRNDHNNRVSLTPKRFK